MVRPRDNDPLQKTGDRASYVEGYIGMARGYVGLPASALGSRWSELGESERISLSYNMPCIRYICSSYSCSYYLPTFLIATRRKVV